MNSIWIWTNFQDHLLRLSLRWSLSTRWIGWHIFRLRNSNMVLLNKDMSALQAAGNFIWPQGDLFMPQSRKSTNAINGTCPDYNRKTVNECKRFIDKAAISCGILKPGSPLKYHLSFCCRSWCAPITLLRLAINPSVQSIMCLSVCNIGFVDLKTVQRPEIIQMEKKLFSIDWTCIRHCAHIKSNYCNPKCSNNGGIHTYRHKLIYLFK